MKIQLIAVLRKPRVPSIILSSKDTDRWLDVEERYKSGKVVSSYMITNPDIEQFILLRANKGYGVVWRTKY